MLVCGIYCLYLFGIKHVKMCVYTGGWVSMQCPQTRGGVACLMNVGVDWAPMAQAKENEQQPGRTLLLLLQVHADTGRYAHSQTHT